MTLSEYGIKWTEFNRNDQLIGKERIFKTLSARAKFIEKLIEKDNFNAIEAYHN